MKTYYRVFYKKLKDPTTAKSCKQIELQADNFEKACKMAKNISKSEKLRLVMIAELPK